VNTTLKLTAVVAAVAALGTTAMAAPNAVGKWKGKIQFTLPKLPPNLTPQQRQMIDQQLAQVRKMTLNLNLQQGGKYSMLVTGGPAGMKNNTDTGTWSQSGNTVTIKSAKKSQNPQANKPQNLTLAANGRTMTLIMPPGMGMNGKVTFTR